MKTMESGFFEPENRPEGGFQGRLATGPLEARVTATLALHTA